MDRKSRSLIVKFFVLAVLVSAAPPATYSATPDKDPMPESPDDSPVSIPALNPLEEQPVRLNPADLRSELEADRVHSAALYSAGRIAERNKQLARALRYYQRAARYDEQNVRALQRAVVLARQLRRQGETARYAELLVRHDVTDSLNVLRSFVYLREQDKADEALALYERATTQSEPNNREPAWIEIHKLAGQLYLSQEKYQQAAAAFDIVDRVFSKPDDYGLNEETVKLLQGDNAQVLYRVMAEAFLKAKQFDKAEAAFATSEKDSADPGRQLYFEARVHAEADRTDRAIEKLQEYFDTEQSNQGDGPYDLLSELLAKQKKDDELLPRLKQAAEADPDNVALAYYLAEKLLAAERWDETRELFERHLEEHPQGRAYRGLARIYHQQKLAEKFLDLAGGLVDRVSSLDVIADETKAIIEDEKFAQEVFDLANKRMSEDTEKVNFALRLAIAELAVEAKRWDLAETFYEHAIAADPLRKAAIYESWGMHLVGAEEYDRAAKIFRRAIDENAAPADKPVFHHYLAGVLTMQDKHDEALNAARTAARKAPDSPEFLARVAWILYRAKRRDEAMKVYADLIKQYDLQYLADGVRAYVREARLTLSHLHALKEDMDVAEELLEQVLDEYPTDIGAYNDLGFLWADRGVHLHRALKMVQTAVAAEPDNEAYLDSLGWVFFRLGRFKEAKKQLEKAAAGDDPDGVILDHLGDAYDKLGKKDAAVKTWRRAVEALEKAGDPTTAEKVSQKLKTEN
jgi:tetratricopeptide (TPR) repeat protein